MSSSIWPDWLSDLPADKLAAACALQLQSWTLPRRFYMAEPPAPVIVAPAPPPPSSLTDAEWAQVKGSFPPASRRRNGVDPRRILDALLFVKTTRVRWVNLSKRLGSGQAIRKTVERWAAQGIWAEFLSRLPELDLVPERTRLLAGIAREWAAKGERYQRQRT